MIKSIEITDPKTIKYYPEGILELNGLIINFIGNLQVLSYSSCTQNTTDRNILTSSGGSYNRTIKLTSVDVSSNNNNVVVVITMPVTASTHFVESVIAQKYWGYRA